MGQNQVRRRCRGRSGDRSRATEGGGAEAGSAGRCRGEGLPLVFVKDSRSCEGCGVGRCAPAKADATGRRVAMQFLQHYRTIALLTPLAMSAQEVTHTLLPAIHSCACCCCCCCCCCHQRVPPHLQKCRTSLSRTREPSTRSQNRSSTSQQRGITRTCSSMNMTVTHAASSMQGLIHDTAARSNWGRVRHDDAMQGDHARAAADPTHLQQHTNHTCTAITAGVRGVAHDAGAHSRLGGTAAQSNWHGVRHGDTMQGADHAGMRTDQNISYGATRNPGCACVSVATWWQQHPAAADVSEPCMTTLAGVC